MDPAAMRKNAKGSLDRRDFVIASLATVGASATFAATAGAKAQDTAASPQPMATVYTGDPDPPQKGHQHTHSTSTTWTPAISTPSISKGCRCLRGNTGTWP